MNDATPTTFQEYLQNVLTGLNNLQDEEEASVEMIDALLLASLRGAHPAEPDERNLTNAATLLGHIAEGIADLEKKERAAQLSGKPYSEIKLAHIGVTFYEGGGDTGDVVWDGGLATALDYLSNDVYWDESRNWAGADTASVSYG